MTELRYTIPLAPITKKNSQQILVNRRTGKPFIMPSKQYREYESRAAWYLRPRPKQPIERPANIRCLFYLPNRRRTDLTNLLEAVDDLLVSAGVIADDHYGVVAAHDGSRCFVCRDNPRTEITITRLPENEQMDLFGGNEWTANR